MKGPTGSGIPTPSLKGHAEDLGSGLRCGDISSQAERLVEEWRGREAQQALNSRLRP